MKAAQAFQEQGAPDVATGLAYVELPLLQLCHSYIRIGNSISTGKSEWVCITEGSQGF